MKSNGLTLLSVALAMIVSVPAVRAGDGEEKVVRKIWFPRFSPDGTLVLAAHGGWDKKEGGEARLYSAKDGTVQHVFPHPRGVRTEPRAG